ncbi:MAG: hypothetical protein RBU23_02810 [Candidatus Auribacterota bacterium]|jgi:acyl-CoA reductase-like NAD-dependent aldehyde dehydrogenase|nr:hypothetical protein [Candidatus Auribacterota bacterium]
MQHTIYVTCPFCEGFLEVNPVTGKVVRSFPAGHKDESADKLQSALKKMKADGSQLEEKFEASKKEMNQQKDKLSQLFEQEKKKIQEEGDVSPPEVRPFDLD